MTAWLTLAVNGLTVVMLGGIIWFTNQAAKNTRATTKLLEHYRLDIDWLTARVDALEAKARETASHVR